MTKFESRIRSNRSWRQSSGPLSGIALTFAVLATSFQSGFADRPNQPSLQRVPVPLEVVEAVSMRLNLHYHEAVGVSITPDDRGGGGLLIMAPPNLQARIAQDAKQLASRLAETADATEVTPMTVHLVHVTWREIEDAFQIIAGGDMSVTTSRNGERASFRVSMNGSGSAVTQSTMANSGSTNVVVDRRANQVTLTCRQSQHSAWRTTMQAIDQPSRFANEETYIYRLVHAKLAPVQRAVRLLRKLEPEKQINRGINQTVAMRGKAQFRTAAFQSGEIAGGQNAGNADAAAAGEEANTEEAEGGVIGDTDIQFVPESGLIIIKGAKRDVQRIKDVIAEIEQQSKITQPEVEVRQLNHADANAVATLLTQLYEDVLAARQGEVSITSLDAPNALLLIGRKEAIQAVTDLIDKIDQPIPETDRLRVYRLQHASATDAETTVREFFTNQPGGNADNRAGVGVRVRVTADYRTNSLIVSASPRDLSEVTRLIEELDVQDVPSTNEIRVVPLRNARAEDLVTVLQDSLTGEPENVPGDTTTPAKTLSIVALGSPGNTILNSGILDGTVLTADTGANAIVVRAPAAGMPLIIELIEQLDQAPGIDSLVKVFTIKNGDAQQLTVALQDLFGDDASTSGTSVGAANLAGLPALSASDSALVPLRFSTDIRTNSIIVSGSDEDLEVVESILLRLDSTGFAERITEVIWLKHQIAVNVATAIQEYVTQRQQFQNIIPQFQTGLGPLDLPDRDIVAVPEAQTNSLLISVSPRMYEEVRRLIDRLDRRPPMVLIKTLIAEVRLDDGFEIGGEFGLQDSLLFDRGVAVTPAAVTTIDPDPAALGAPLATAAGNIANGFTPGAPGFNFNGVGLPNNNASGRGTLASQGVTAFGVAQSALDPTNNGGFVFSAASESINLFLRTLQTANRLQILSRPEVMTADNTQGFVTVGQSFPRPTELSVTQQGQTLIGVEDVDVGIILRVTPRVGADGLILMDIDASRSAINFDVGQVIGFANGDANQPITVPAIDQTVAQSTITAFDGQTVVFGGLIQKQRSNFTRRVPYLSDIPILGTFFKYDRETEFRSELLIVMTPRLVTGDEDLEYVKQVESSRMSWCLADVVEAHGDVGLSGGYGLWGPATGPTIYPDVHPTVDVFPAQDMPGGARAIQAKAIQHGTALPPGVELNPGETIVSEADLIESPTMAPTPSYGTQSRQFSAPNQYSAPPMSQPAQLPLPEPQLLAPETLPQGLPAPVNGVLPAPAGSIQAEGASTKVFSIDVPVRSASTRMQSPASNAVPATAEKPSPAKRWSNFSGKLGSFIQQPKN